MENIIVVLVITAVFDFGYYVMRAVDRFLLENERRNDKRNGNNGSPWSFVYLEICHLRRSTRKLTSLERII